MEDKDTARLQARKQEKGAAHHGRKNAQAATRRCARPRTANIERQAEEPKYRNIAPLPHKVFDVKRAEYKAVTTPIDPRIKIRVQVDFKAYEDLGWNVQ